ncbi:glutamine amidotransferase subunit DUG2 [Rhodotorula paludigena]|uniref:glutamine amidotransferase subunit DUG2 n=1 Tax=Rhodotorula paludigena TaxID=86838 RepID=UPI003175AF60
MSAPEASAEHVQRTANLPAAVPVPAAPADHVEAAPPRLDFSPRTQAAWGTPGWSALSASRPLDFHPAISKLPTPPTALASDEGREGGAMHSPAALPMDGQCDPAAADVRLPTLLSTLSASDDESILCIAVEEQHSSEGCPRDQRARDYKGRGAAGDALMHGGRVYGGSQGGSIHVWDLATLSPCARLTGHDGAILALQLVPARDWLISASGDGTVRVWHTPTLSLLYLLHPPHDNIGDILSLAWIPTELLEEDDHAGHRRGTGLNLAGGSGTKGSTGRLYAGCQDTSIQWIDLPPAHVHSSQPPPSPLLAASHTSTSGYFSTGSPHSPPIFKAPNKFFDSLSQADKNRARVVGASAGGIGGLHSASTGSLITLGARASTSYPGTPDEGKGAASSSRDSPKLEGGEAIELQFQAECIVPFAHFGYVYCLLPGKSKDRTVLVSGSGDELVKLWRPTASDLLPIATLSSECDAVLALASRDNTLFAGHQGGVIKVWDLDTLTCVRVLRPHEHDILTLSVLSSSLYSGSANGTLQRWDLRTFKLVHEWEAKCSIVLSSETRKKGSGDDGKGWLLTGGNDASLKVGELFHTLAKFISIKTIADEAHREDCRQGALCLKRVLRELGADTVLLPGAADKNPIVLATFRANASPKPNRFEAPRRKRVLHYGHYDVVPASAPELWSHDPFTMTGQDGWLYGRGVSDNKGPVLAVAAAAAELRRKQEMEIDLVMVIEGEEETGSAGFQQAVRQNRDLIGDIDVILVSNSYWLGEDVPCLTFGLRGVIHARVKVESSNPDLHSGLWGGVTSEPLNDLIRVLASLTDADGRVRIPGFLDDVRKLEASEQRLYDRLVERTDGIDRCKKMAPHDTAMDPMKSLINRWRQPALSVHKVEVPGGAQKSLIPNSAFASVSLRIVPDQSLEDIVEKLKAHLRKSFAVLRTSNSISIEINHVADWWLGDVDSPYVGAMSSCIASQWGIEPLFIREGGSIPSLPFLEAEFGAEAVHFPMGTSSDSAHLPDERIRVLNLENGKAIVGKWFTQIASLAQ